MTYNQLRCNILLKIIHSLQKKIFDLQYFIISFIKTTYHDVISYLLK